MVKNHRKLIRHYEQAQHLHELTFSCYCRRPLLTNDNWRRILATCLSSACDEERFRLIAFVFMPEHVHLLVYPETPISRVSRFLARVKQPVSSQIRTLLETQGTGLVAELTVQERPGKFCFRFWQEGPGFDRNIYSADALSASMGYIHRNPVNRGLCSTAEEFRWSSARFHMRNIIDEDLPKLYRPDPDWFDTAGTLVESS